ncbi:50S ribosomal protein L4 [Anaerohalosphaera lusitana]|uniref:Large ribosomal subunit protein uL4 n=1 Tax=Anaerohalosphaera lusitana TaxID=1936003 RepID=A0A1U9NPI8_9BACT|nr:50S ribosomal protein L4 [Anaerohalosphaera lusitana]AQT69852.1 50S ribosomal protein L4 [Anaerohalosphaera lusitana]
MIDVAVYNREGKEVESLQVDEAVFGGSVRYPLLKQAIVMYHANKRVGTAANKSRGMVAGSTRKLFRQKGTGNARVGNSRTNKRVGGGVAFAKGVRDYGKDMPKKQRRLARDSAILAKLQAGGVVVVDELTMDAPKTKDFAGVLKNLKIDRSCLVTLSEQDTNIYKSARNVPKVSVLDVAQLNAGDICNRQKMLITKDALMSLVNRS